VGQQPDFSPEGLAAAHDQVMMKFEAIHRLVDELAPERAEFARTSADVRRIKAAGKSAILIGVENAYSMGEDIANVQKFYDLGARYMSLAHNGHNQLCDSHTGESDGVFPFGGLSPLGREVVQEMNRVGIMVDLSHPSVGAARTTPKWPKWPIPRDISAKLSPALTLAAFGCRRRRATARRWSSPALPSSPPTAPPARWPAPAATSRTMSCRLSPPPAASSRPLHSTAS